MRERMSRFLFTYQLHTFEQRLDELIQEAFLKTLGSRATWKDTCVGIKCKHIELLGIRPRTMAKSSTPLAPILLTKGCP